jgi:hypothetical protein
MKRALQLLAILLMPLAAAAQFTTVTGTVVDPNGIPYAGGTISATLVLPGTGSPTLNGSSYSPPTQPAGLDANGSFTIRLADNTVLLPASTTWNFTVCSAKGTVNPAIGTGSQCFTLASPITISGSTQSITTQLHAAALALTIPTTGGVTTVSATAPIVSSGGTTPNISCPTCSTGTAFPLFAPDGSATTPSYSWSANHNAGWFHYSIPPEGSDAYGFSVVSPGFGIFDIFNGGAFSHGTLGASGDISTNNNLNGLAVNVTTVSAFQEFISGPAQLTGVVTQGSHTHSTASDYIVDGSEVSTPGTPSAGTQRGYFKAGKGWCAVDSGAVEYCTSSGNGTASILVASTTLTGSVSVGNSDTSIVTHTITMPSSGCPCRAKVSYGLMLTSTNSGIIDAAVNDGTGNYFATSQTLVTGSASGYGATGSGTSRGTYANNASVTFDLRGQATNSGSVTVNTTANSGGNFQGSYLQIDIFASN